jgi:uncharacterized protein GlcG (DUF336 family)
MSLKSSLTAAALGTFVFIGASYAQAPQKPNPFDVIPDKMPNDIPYGAPVSLAQADAVIAAALAESKRRDWKLNCAVVDSGANLVSFKRQDGAQLGSIAIAEHKARAAVKYRRETKALENGVQNGATYLLTLDDVIASRGGIPLMEGGKIVGAIGCSGGTGSQDEVVAKAGVAAFK